MAQLKQQTTSNNPIDEVIIKAKEFAIKKTYVPKSIREKYSMKSSGGIVSFSAKKK